MLKQKAGSFVPERTPVAVLAKTPQLFCGKAQATSLSTPMHGGHVVLVMD
jgi:hypothetical protein